MYLCEASKYNDLFDEVVAEKAKVAQLQTELDNYKNQDVKLATSNPQITAQATAVDPNVMAAKVITCGSLLNDYTN